MSKDDILFQPRLPARLTTQQTAALLGFKEHDIPVLIREKLLKPLGNPVSSAPKFFAAVQIEELTRDTKWQDKATKAVSQNWQERNGTRPSRKANGNQRRTSAPLATDHHVQSIPANES